DPRMMHSGIVGGMSGSPIYIDGKLVGALAYGYRFNKDPMGGITPISNMLAIDKLPFRPDAMVRPKSPQGQGRSRAGTVGWADAILGLGVSPLPPRKRPQELSDVGGLVALGAPMSVSGFGPGATRLLAEELDLLPVRGGSGRGQAPSTAASPKKWVAGDSVSVVLIRGDNSAAPNGTVTWVGGRRGERLLAFGHPMFDAGPSNLPIADARVHTIISSVERSVKLSSPLQTRGTMIQDRQPAIALRTDLVAPMIPVITHLYAAEAEMGDRVYNSEVAEGVSLTPALIAGLLVDAAEEGGSDSTEVMAMIEHTIALETSRGPRSIKISDEYFFERGLDLRMLGRSRGILVLRALLDNQYEVARIRSVEQSIRLSYGAQVDIIEEVRLAQGEVRAGELAALDVTFRAHRGERRRERIDLRIPEDAGDQEIVVHLVGGDFVRPYRPMPNNLDDIVDTLEAAYPARSLVVSIYREGEGLSTHHGLLDDVPGSVLETLKAEGTTLRDVRFKRMARRVLPTAKVIEGEHQLTISVLPSRTKP
ncbi:MAG TPA: hypothetical protein ENJ18_08460, partial [Nannocystis exedens]|nr:hypothetical protein [Nannocystis exedens]